MMNNNDGNKGYILMVVLVVTALFVVTAAGLASLAVDQNKLGLKRIAWSRAFEIAEAGLNYYRWVLAHDPSDYYDGTGGSPGPYIHDYSDPYGGVIGKFSLDITPPDACSSVVLIKSTGWTLAEPNVKRVLQGQYGLPSLAEFAFLTNSNVWFGEDEELHGPVHSNGGIRQDGENDSIVTSSKETYICGPEHGCNNETKPGVWGDGGKQTLWKYPVPQVDFNAIISDLADLKSQAQSSGTYYDSTGIGYHVVLYNNRTYDLYRVTSLKPALKVYTGEKTTYVSLDIQDEDFLGNYNLPNNCSILFFEDDVWVEGELDGYSLTIVSAELPEVSNTNTSIIINGDITFKNRLDTNSLALIAQKDILIPFYSAPNDLDINAVLLAKNGKVVRYYYYNTNSPYSIRDSIEVYGSIITNKIWTWTWVNSSGNVVSGYRNTETLYDPNLKYYPPPGFPTKTEYEFIKWEEITEK